VRCAPRPVRCADDGNAILEFVALTALFLIPLTYLILAVFQVPGAAYGATEAAREAGHSFVEADSLEAAYAESCAAARIALLDQRVAGTADCSGELLISCVSDHACSVDLSAGSIVRAHVALDVPLPFLPSALFGIPLTIRVSASHDEVVDQYRSAP
jgi:hypothetical protein